MKLHYTLAGVSGLEYALAIVSEIKAEMGLLPDYIELDSGERIRFSKEDFKKLEKGDMRDTDYIEKHRVIQ